VRLDAIARTQALPGNAALGARWQPAAIAPRACRTNTSATSSAHPFEQRQAPLPRGLFCFGNNELNDFHIDNEADKTKMPAPPLPPAR
jgi:hypothetical protein